MSSKIKRKNYVFNCICRKKYIHSQEHSLFFNEQKIVQISKKSYSKKSIHIRSVKWKELKMLKRR